MTTTPSEPSPDPEVVPSGNPEPIHTEPEIDPESDPDRPDAAPAPDPF
jgi:hypothetical protein